MKMMLNPSEAIMEKNMIPVKGILSCSFKTANIPMIATIIPIAMIPGKKAGWNTLLKRRFRISSSRYIFNDISSRTLAHILLFLNPLRRN
jgi:hypothetical protein